MAVKNTMIRVVVHVVYYTESIARYSVRVLAIMTVQTEFACNIIIWFSPPLPLPQLENINPRELVLGDRVATFMFYVSTTHH